MNKSKSNLAFIFIYFKKDDKIIMRLGDNMLKKIKKILRIVVIVMLFVLTINVTYDIGTAFANKTPSHSVNEIQEINGDEYIKLILEHQEYLYFKLDKRFFCVKNSESLYKINKSVLE